MTFKKYKAEKNTLFEKYRVTGIRISHSRHPVFFDLYFLQIKGQDQKSVKHERKCCVSIVFFYLFYDHKVVINLKQINFQFYYIYITFYHIVLQFFYRFY